MLFRAVGEVRRAVVAHVVPGERVGLGEVEEDPRTVLAHDLLRLPPERDARRRVRRRHRRVVEAVERGVAVVAVVRPRRDVLRVEELQKVLGVRVVADPAEHEERHVALVHRVKVGVPRHVARFEPHADAVVEALHQLRLLARRLVRTADREGDLKAAARLRVDPPRIARLGEEALRLLHVEGIGERRLQPPLHARRHGAVARLDAVVEEALPRRRVERAVERLAQLPVRTQHGVIHVDSHVHHRHRGRAVQVDAARFQVARKPAVGPHHRVPVVVRDLPEEVDFAGEEHEPLRRHVVHHEVVDLVVGRRLDLAPPPPRRVAAEAHPVVAPPFGEPVRTRPHRDAAELHPVVRHRLVRHHRRVRHRHQPREDVQRTLERDAHRARIDGLDARHGLHRPESARRIRLVGEPVERIDDIPGDDGPPLPTREARIRLEARPLADAERVHEPVRRHPGQVAEPALQAVRTREVVHFKQRLVDE